MERLLGSTWDAIARAVISALVMAMGCWLAGSWMAGSVLMVLFVVA